MIGRSLSAAWKFMSMLVYRVDWSDFLQILGLDKNKNRCLNITQ
jgi:hypothetical protein